MTHPGSDARKTSKSAESDWLERKLWTSKKILWLKECSFKGKKCLPWYLGMCSLTANVKQLLCVTMWNGDMPARMPSKIKHPTSILCQKGGILDWHKMQLTCMSKRLIQHSNIAIQTSASLTMVFRHFSRVIMRFVSLELLGWPVAWLHKYRKAQSRDVVTVRQLKPLQSSYIILNCHYLFVNDLTKQIWCVACWGSSQMIACKAKMLCSMAICTMTSSSLA